MSDYIDFLDSCFTIAKADMPRAASLLPECYRDSSKPPLDQVVSALEECGFSVFTGSGAIESIFCETGVLSVYKDEVFDAIAPAVEDGSYLIYWDSCCICAVGFFFHDGVCEFKLGRVVFD